jgi:hypothetical protein
MARIFLSIGLPAGLGVTAASNGEVMVAVSLMVPANPRGECLSKQNRS